MYPITSRIAQCRPGLALALALLAAAPALASSADPAPQVSVETGLLRGSESDGIHHFFGIPYAVPPIGDLRWKDPVPAKPWQGERDATSFGPTCPQAVIPAAPQPPMSEDCLTLNIWAPPAQDKPMPVMVWIHGGGYLFGSNRDPAFDGTQFAKKGVVLVTINYRLGPLGFMAHPELSAESPHHSSGNYGLLDQMEALRWVKANIHAFGGDPDNVTIFGESAGSGAVNMLQASPLAKGLFNRTIGESTSQMDPDGGLIGRQDLHSAEAYGVSFAKKLGAGSLADLRAMSVEKILSTPTFFWPTERDEYVLPDLVYNIYAKGKQNDVPTLVGSNSDEGSTIRIEWVKRTPENAAIYDRLYGKFSDPIRQSATDSVQWQMRVWAGLQAKTGKEKSWLYWFDRAWPGQKDKGAFHGSEIIYVFKTLDSENQPWTQEDRNLSELMSNYWVNFARNGNPNGPNVPQWPSYSNSDPKLMRLSPEPAVIDPPRPEAQTYLDAAQARKR